MAYSLFTYLAFFFLTINFCHGFNPKLLNMSKSYEPSPDWATTTATWYGDPTGAGSEGGSCGYQTAVEKAPFSSKITALGPSLYNNGKGCGTCYQLRTLLGEAVTVVGTDSCPGCPNDHLFDLSGTAFGGMAISGQENALRDLGTFQIQYKSVDCEFTGVKVAFRVDLGSNTNYMALAVEYNGNALTGVELQQANSNGKWIPMQLSWGTVWKTDLPNGESPPFSIKLSEGSKVVVAEGVIPAGYVAGATYTSTVNFGG